MSNGGRGQRILVVDDDAQVVDFLCESLGAEGYDTTGATAGDEALRLVRARPFDLLLVDVEMPRMRGTELLTTILKELPGQLVLLMTAFGSIELAVSAVRAGACDFVTKPFKIEALLLAIERALRDRRTRREVVRIRSTEPPDATGEEVVARSAGMRRAVAAARRVATTEATVLLTGESGTGKSVLARLIHRSGSRRDGPFVALGCATLPGSLVEYELFGVCRGAFADTRQDRPGLFAAASGGTLFLDEVGELTLDLQAKLLHVLETGRVRPLGSTTEAPVYCRTIAATSRSLEDMVRSGDFRSDLYYRLNVVRIDVPPLRERKEDVAPLVDLLLRRASERHGREVIGVAAHAMRRLASHPWPGNVRELANVVERAVALGEHDTILPEDLDFTSTAGDLEMLLGDATDRNASLEEVERAYVRRVLDAHGGNKAAAARVLRINRRTLYRKLEPEDAGALDGADGLDAGDGGERS